MYHRRSTSAGDASVRSPRSFTCNSSNVSPGRTAARTSGRDATPRRSCHIVLPVRASKQVGMLWTIRTISGVFARRRRNALCDPVLPAATAVTDGDDHRDDECWCEMRESHRARRRLWRRRAGLDDPSRHLCSALCGHLMARNRDDASVRAGAFGKRADGCSRICVDPGHLARVVAI